MVWRVFHARISAVITTIAASLSSASFSNTRCCKGRLDIRTNETNKRWREREREFSVSGTSRQLSGINIEKNCILYNLNQRIQLHMTIQSFGEKNIIVLTCI